MPHFMIVLIFFKTFLDNKMSIFEEYGAFISFPVSCDFCQLLITFANSLDPAQARQNVGSGSKLFDTLMVYLKVLKKLILKINPQMTKKMQNYPACKVNFQNSQNVLSDHEGPENINYTIVKHGETFYGHLTALSPAVVKLLFRC